MGSGLKLPTVSTTQVLTALQTRNDAHPSNRPRFTTKLKTPRLSFFLPTVGQLSSQPRVDPRQAWVSYGQDTGWWSPHPIEILGPYLRFSRSESSIST